MDTLARSFNVPAGAGSRSATESKALLSQCRALARAKFARIVADALDKIENDLFSLAEASTSRTEQQVLFEAMAHAKQYRIEIASAFERSFTEIFERRVSARHGISAPSGERLNLEQLSLVDDTAVEERLVLSDLARKTKNRIDPDELLGIRARVGHLLAAGMLEDETNPLSPEAVFEALRLACAKVPGEFAVKRSLLSAFQPYVADGITRVYADVNQNLIKHHVLPRIKHQVMRVSDHPAQATSAALAASQALNLAKLWGQQGAAVTGVTQGIPLHPLLAGGVAGSSGGLGTGAVGVAGIGGIGRFGGGIAGGSAPGSTVSQPVPLGLNGPIDLTALLANALNGPPANRAYVTRMLAEPARYAFEPALATPASPALMTSLSALQATVPPSPVGFDFMAALGGDVRAQSHPLDQLTIELVNMVFDYILDDASVPEAVKHQIARLLIVAVKAAILDRTFFARRQHPMRQLLDRIADAATDPDIATEEGSKFVVGLRGIVEYIIEKFADDLTIFSAALGTLEKLVEENRRSCQEEIEPVAAELARNEEAEIAHATALAEIKRRVTRKTPEFVRDFLFQWWSKTLEDAYTTEHQGDDSWTHRLGVVDALVWSVSPLSTAEIQQLASMLPTLMRSLLRGMNAIDMPAEARHAFFNQLMEAHTEAITLAKAKSAHAATAIAREEALLVGEPLAGDTGPSSEPEVGDYFFHAARSLERGAVVEFIDGNSTVRSKLSWVSPQQTILLFTSSIGGARKLSPTALADLLSEGKARVVEASGALMDRVVNAMMGPPSVPAIT
jgi:Protein of unknown function (DUF1631)